MGGGIKGAPGCGFAPKPPPPRSGQVGARGAAPTLETAIREFAADQQPLEPILNYLRDATASNMVVNWNALAAAGVDRKTPVSLRLKDVPLRKVLQTVLDVAAGGTGKLGFQFE